MSVVSSLFSSIVGVVVALALLASLSRPAYADLYGDYVRRLEAQIRAAADYGITPQELSQIELAVQARPDGWTQEAEAFYAALERIAVLFADWGYTAEELEVLDLIARAAPPVQHPQPVYQQTYAVWSREVADLERAFNDWGLTNEESRVLTTLRGLQPRLVSGGGYVPPPSVPQPPLPPQPPTTQPWPPTQPGWPGAPRTLNVCGQQIQVVMERMYYGFPRMTPTYVALLAGPSRDLVEIDTASCQQRWLGDGVLDFAVQMQLRSVTFVTHGGRAYYARGGSGDVYQIGDDFTRVSDDGRGNQIRLVDRAGRARTVQYNTSEANIAVYLDGASSWAKLRYRTVWRPLTEM